MASNRKHFEYSIIIFAWGRQKYKEQSNEERKAKYYFCTDAHVGGVSIIIIKTCLSYSNFITGEGDNRKCGKVLKVKGA